MRRPAGPLRSKALAPAAAAPLVRLSDRRPLHDRPPPDVTVPQGGIVEDVAMTGAFAGFESGGGLYLGLGTTEAEYRLTSSSDPYQVVIDIRSRTSGQG